MKAAATRRFVLDASVAVAWCFDGETTRYTEHVLDALSARAEAITVAIWPLEVANALLMAERRKRISLADVTAMLQALAALPISVQTMDSRGAFNHVLSVARQQHLTAYDAAYLELALRTGLPLASIDDKLNRAAREMGIAEY
jgi:predicted nucleic acid-binding protein